MNNLIQNYSEQLVKIQREHIWIGTNYEKKVGDLSSEIAFKQPLPNVHSVAEIISHLTTWRKECMLKLTIGKGDITDEAEENWYSNSHLKEIGWQVIKQEYDDSLIPILEFLSAKEDSFLNKTYYDPDFKGDYTYTFLIEGMIHHDVYHLGQIGLVLKLINN